MTRKTTKIILIALIFLVICGVIGALHLYFTKVDATQTTYLYIYPSTSYSDLCKDIKGKGIAKNLTSFNLYAKALGYDKNMKAGCYEVSPDMKMLNLVSNLKKGRQKPVKITIGKSRLVEDFAQKTAQSLMFSEQDLMKTIHNQGFADSVFFFVIPNTYELYWTISPEDFLLRMRKESEKFWLTKSKELQSDGLTRQQIMVLASIVEEETNKIDEKPKVAGVYVNRLHKDMLLQADPTVKYALKNFSLRRIKGEHLQVVSPYNTYKVKGLPPSPICLPSMSSINAVLNYEHHDFLFFCAKEDFSGYHNFAANDKQHAINRQLYIRELNKRGIN
ncbi:MAG: endolytic transglycosylase MltG [Bacteroidales bacterium]|nr:endolytic transglycosylase MltG [Bacteroidales bacterium]